MSITAPQGFRAAGVTAGLKASGNPDLALVVNDGPSKAAAAVFTSNRVAAAPVHWSREVVKDGRVDAVILNSGGANACTGPQGFQNTHTTAEKTAEVLGVSATRRRGLLHRPDRRAAARWTRSWPGSTPPPPPWPRDGGADAATAIMTTDSVSKQAVFTGTDADGNEFTIGGMAKGAGMLAPGLATMLVVLTTDADVQPDMLDVVLRDATRVTFDRADSDGCMSTNDTVVLLASGASGAVPSAGELRRGPDPGLRRAGPQADRRRRGRQPRHRRSGRSTPPASGTPKPSAAPWPAPTCSRPPSSARTPTGAACSPPSAPPTPPSNRTS